MIPVGQPLTFPRLKPGKGVYKISSSPPDDVFLQNMRWLSVQVPIPTVYLSGQYVPGALDIRELFPELMDYVTEHIADPTISITKESTHEGTTTEYQIYIPYPVNTYKDVGFMEMLIDVLHETLVWAIRVAQVARTGQYTIFMGEPE